MSYTLVPANESHTDWLVELHWNSFGKIYGLEAKKSESGIREAFSTQISYLTTTIALDSSNDPVGYVRWGTAGLLMGAIISGAIAFREHHADPKNTADISEPNHLFNELCFIEYLNSKFYIPNLQSLIKPAERRHETPDNELSIKSFDSKDIVKYETAIDPKHRRRGVATTLTNFVIEQTRKKGAPHVFAFCYEPQNKQSPDQGMRVVNLKMGFSPILIFKTYYDNGADAVLLGKNVS